MWFNSIQSEGPHQGLTYQLHTCRNMGFFESAGKAAAWLSSARAVGCRFKYHNERNPHSLLNFFKENCLAYFAGRKVGTTSSQHGAYALGDTHPTMANNNELQLGNGKLISEISPQFRLGSATRPHEVGIASKRRSAGCVEYVLGSCTHRPSSQQSWGCPKPRRKAGLR